MARYFFDATSESLLVTDFHGREIDHKEEVRLAMLEAVQAIRMFLGDEHVSETWTLEVRLGENNRIAAVPFAEIEASADAPCADEPASLAVAA